MLNMSQKQNEPDVAVLISILVVLQLILCFLRARLSFLIHSEVHFSSGWTKIACLMVSKL